MIVFLLAICAVAVVANDECNVPMKMPDEVNKIMDECKVEVAKCRTRCFMLKMNAIDADGFPIADVAFDKFAVGEQYAAAKKFMQRTLTACNAKVKEKHPDVDDCVKVSAAVGCLADHIVEKCFD